MPGLGETAGAQGAQAPEHLRVGAGSEYVWDGDDLVHERVRGEDGAVLAPMTTWVFEPGTFTPLAKLEGRKRYGVVTDHLGTPRILTTEAGKVAWQAQLDVYGVVRDEDVAAGAGAGEIERTSNPWRYPGQYEDAETGLYYNRFRYYDPETGRYLSEDPIGLAGGVGLYGYVGAPSWWVDPFGLTCTRTGVKRDNPGDWKRLATLWKDTGVDALSDANLKNIDERLAPIVDDAWIRWFPGDAALKGEKISMHHVGGSRLSVPLPASRHKAAHMPGGYRFNPGGPGQSG